MTLDTTRDLFFLVLAIATGWVAIFVCWALYEIARMLHQANAVVSETRDKLNRMEQAIVSIKERLETSVNYFGMLAEGGKSIVDMFRHHEEKRDRRRMKKSKSDDDE